MNEQEIEIELARYAAELADLDAEELLGEARYQELCEEAIQENVEERRQQLLEQLGMHKEAGFLYDTQMTDLKNKWRKKK